MRSFACVVAALVAGCASSEEDNVGERSQTEDSLVIRTDFSDDAAWDAICAAIRNPSTEFQFRAYVTFLCDRNYDGLTPDELWPQVAERPRYHSFFFVVDRQTLTDPDHPILVVDLNDRPGRTFRVIPSAMWHVENNLSIANVDFDDYLDSLDQSGVYRGAPGSPGEP
jgi:hypothetical protein